MGLPEVNSQFLVVAEVRCLEVCMARGHPVDNAFPGIDRDNYLPLLRIALNVVRVVIASGSIFTSISAGLSEACARSKAAAN